MCEFCAKTEVTVEKLADEEESSCEWISEEFGPGACDEPAVFAVSEWYVSEHLCAAHALATEKEMAEGLGEFLDTVGFRSGFELRPIEPGESCEYVAMDTADWSLCGKNATHAKYSRYILCLR
jgi:hypothetical protein